MYTNNYRCIPIEKYYRASSAGGYLGPGRQRGGVRRPRNLRPIAPHAAAPRIRVQRGECGAAHLDRCTRRLHHGQPVRIFISATAIVMKIAIAMTAAIALHIVAAADLDVTGLCRLPRLRTRHGL